MNETPPPTRLVTALIYHHAGHFDALLLDLLPKLDEARRRGWLLGVAWQRHWLRGPHLKLHCHVAGASEPQLHTLIEGQVGRYFRHQEAGAPLSQDAYRQRYAAVAALELVADPLSTLAPDRSIVWETFAQREQMFGSPALATLARDFMLEGHDIFAALLREGAAASGRGALLYAVARTMMAFPQGFEDVAGAASCFRSHAEGFLHAFPGKTPLREQFLKRRRQAQPQLEAALAEALDPDARLQPWIELVRTYARRAELEFRRGATLPTIADFQRLEAALPTEVRPERSTFRGYSPVHTALEDPDSALSRQFRSGAMQARRFTANLMYDRFTALGLTSGERYMLCYLTAHTLETHYHGSDWWSRHQLSEQHVGAAS